jgi:hypothetical protein
MKYAEKQIVRPSQEGGCDYGHGKRRVLFRRGKKDILKVDGAKHWGGVGSDRQYSAMEIAAFPVEDQTCRQKTLAEGRMTNARWAEIAEAIFAHLGMRFDVVKLVSIEHTLLLDEPGEVDGPPARDPAPKKVHPRIESDRLWRVYQDDDGTLKPIGCVILKQGGGKITYQMPNGRENEKRTKDLIEDGAAGTLEGAAAAYLRSYEERVAEAVLRLTRAADNYSDANDTLREQQHKIEAMFKELPR